jgi:SAM-dependent methyltransferase
MPFEPRYAQLYDAIYAAKDYAFELGQVLEFARQYGVEVRTIVDYGCGTGSHARRFAEKGIKVYGIDRSQHMLAAAREKTKGLQNVEFLHDSEPGRRFRRLGRCILSVVRRGVVHRGERCSRSPAELHRLSPQTGRPVDIRFLVWPQRFVTPPGAPLEAI